jgi:hypothetical protein
MTPEGKLKKQVKDALDERGFWRAGSARPQTVVGWYYMPVSNGMGVHGIPDFVCCWEGKFFGIETKAPGGSPTANQEKRHEEIRAALGWVLVADNIDTVKEFLDARHRRPSK